ncbi:hypothetical protein [Clostridium beijerinckii]|uniref:hypothetical protein n=1 Tax=Clostridium beijerinckii TaxID=1520 RepID=UPI0012D31E81|nr:hypothetical protein [Clostridium beijerinckii]
MAVNVWIVVFISIRSYMVSNTMTGGYKLRTDGLRFTLNMKNTNLNIVLFNKMNLRYFCYALGN